MMTIICDYHDKVKSKVDFLRLYVLPLVLDQDDEPLLDLGTIFGAFTAGQCGSWDVRARITFAQWFKSGFK